MAAAMFVHDGNAIDHTPGADVAAGAVVVQGELIGIAKTAIAAGALGALALSGVFDLPKATGVGTAITAGALIYWDVADAQATTDADTGTNKLLGKTIAAAADADATVRVRLAQ